MIFNFFKKNKKISDETIRKAEENLKKIYEDGEKFELKLLKELNAELRKEKLVKEAADQGSKISDQMTLDALKSKYEAALKENGGQRNENIETLMKNFDKR